MFLTAQSDTLFLGGQKVSGEDIRNQNVLAAQTLCNFIKTSLGPMGLDKMLVDEIGEVTISNDGATILSMLDVQHPTAKILVDLAKQQDKEIGDGTTSVVLIANDLLKRANDLIKLRVHPTTIITGYKLALKEAVKYISEVLSHPVESLNNTVFLNIAKTSLLSKSIGLDSNFFSKLIVDAILAVKTVNSRGETKYPIKAINILKSHGKSTLESVLVDGYAINCTVASQAMVKSIKNPKIACLDINFQKVKMAMGVLINITDLDQLEKFRKRENDIVIEKIKKILNAGANVVFTTKGIDDLCLKEFIEASAMAVRRCRKDDLKRIARATGATFITNLSNLEGDEVFDSTNLGSASEVLQTRFGDNECILVKGTNQHSSASIILRGPNEYFLDEMERSLHDSLSVVKKTLETNTVVPGGGAVEAALNVYLENLAITFGSREQLAIAEFSNALLSIPKNLILNAAKDPLDLISKLRAYHTVSQTASLSETKKKNYKNYGLDLFEGKVTDKIEQGILEPTISKINSLKYAVEACIAILRIDTMIVVTPDPPKTDPHHQ